jgi:hypothetical protein
MRLIRMAKRLTRKNVILVLTSHLLSPDESALLQILDDPLNSTLGDADLERDVTKHKLRVLMKYR